MSANHLVGLLPTPALPNPWPAADLDSRGSRGPHSGCWYGRVVGPGRGEELWPSINDTGMDAREDAMIPQEQGAPLQEREREPELPFGFLKDGVGEDSGPGEECAWERTHST